MDASSNFYYYFCYRQILKFINMELSEKTVQEALAKINAKCAPFECPMCKYKGSFLFGKAEFQHIGFNRKENQIFVEGDTGIEFIPVIIGICPQCGFSASFNLHVLGLE